LVGGLTPTVLLAIGVWHHRRKAKPSVARIGILHFNSHY
jgi:hypothetical protein